ncbi:unnamed protein product [Malus baccata var. baccata]
MSVLFPFFTSVVNLQEPRTSLFGLFQKTFADYVVTQYYPPVIHIQTSFRRTKGRRRSSELVIGRVEEKMESTGCASISNLNFIRNRIHNCFDRRGPIRNLLGSVRVHHSRRPRPELSVLRIRMTLCGDVVCCAFGAGPKVGFAVDERPSTDLVDGVKDNGGSSISNFLYPSQEFLPDDKEITIFDHLEELRQRLFISVIAVGVSMMGCFAYSKDLIVFLEALVKEQGVKFLQLAPGEFLLFHGLHDQISDRLVRQCHCHATFSSYLAALENNGEMTF